MNHLFGSTIHTGRHAGRLLRRYWSGLISLALTFLLVSQVAPSLAAPLHQTVPPPTPTSESQPVPTATPVPDNNDDDDDDDNSEPTATPVPDNNDDDDDDNNQPPPPPPTNTPAPQATVAPGLTGSVSVQRLNVRQGPGTNHPVIGTVLQGETVTILSRNEFGDWWRACCISGTTQDGWMAAQFITPNFDLGQANVLIAIDGAIPTPPPPTAVPTVDPNVVPTTTVPTTAGLLELQVQQDPPYAWQGGTITLLYQLNNAGTTAATNVEVRNELPAEFGFLSADALNASEFLTETAPISRTVVIFRWSELQAGATVSASVQVSVSAQLINGTVLENLAVAGADNVQPVTAGITIGMPPVNLPDFR
jgi:uncharacterized repeat protein (TIGR01451 family)